MTRLLTAYEDFLERTLAHVPGTLGKVFLLSEMSSGSREYEHWGLTRTFGEEAAEEVMREEHIKVFLGELATPLRELWSELLSKAEAEDVCVQEYSKMLKQASARLPFDLAGGSRQHHHYIFMSLALLAQSQRSSR